MQQDAGQGLLPGRPREGRLRRHGRGPWLLHDEQARRAQRECRRRHRRARIPADGLARPAVSGPQGHPRGGRGRRFHGHGLQPHLGSPGRQGDNPRLPARHEGHARRERSSRGPRRGRQDDLRGRTHAGRGGRQQQGHGHRVHPHAAGRTGRFGPPPPRARQGQRIRHRVRPRPARHRPDAGPLVDRRGRRGRRRQPRQTQGRRRDIRDRADRRLRHRGRSHRIGNGRPGSRRRPPLRLRRGRVS